MKTRTINIYEFHELSDKAKEAAVSAYCTSSEQYAWADEALAAIKALAVHFGGKAKDYEIDWVGGTCPSFMIFDMPDMEPDEINTRLNALGSFNLETLRGDGECKLTGYCMDEDAIDGFRQAFAKGETALNVLMQAAFETWIKAAHADAQHQFSAEGYAEHCECNDFEFDEDGGRI